MKARNEDLNYLGYNLIIIIIIVIVIIIIRLTAI